MFYNIHNIDVICCRMSVTVLYYTVVTHNSDISIRMNAIESIENEIGVDKLLPEISFTPADRERYTLYEGMYRVTTMYNQNIHSGYHHIDGKNVK